MFVKPYVYTYEQDEVTQQKSLLTIERGPEKVLWEMDANKVYVYKLYNVIQVVGDWYEKEFPTNVTGVLNLKYSEENMKKARHDGLTASEILALNWEDWFIYKLNR